MTHTYRTTALACQLLAALATLTLAAPLRAQEHHHHEAPAAAASGASAPSAADWIDGEIRRVDTAQQRLTLKHGDIRHLDMPGMTMAFRLKPGLLSAEQLAALKVGDKIAFKVESRQGQLQLTGLRPRTAE